MAVTGSRTIALICKTMAQQPGRDICNTLKDLKAEVSNLDIPDKTELKQAINRLMEIKHCDGRR
jgi:quinolinate synthase